MSNEPKSFREQLLALRPQVEVAEKERHIRVREEKEKTKEKLAEELKRNPPGLLAREFREIEDTYKSANKHFFPFIVIEQAMDELKKFNDRISRYKHYEGRFPDIYTPSMSRAIDHMVRSISELKGNIDEQWEQWQEVEELLKDVVFRDREKNDSSKLVDVAKNFHQRAHGIQLDIPRKFFAAKKENFYVAEAGKKVLGYFENFPEEKRITFAIDSVKGINFIKLARSLVYKFCKSDLHTEALEEVNIRIYSRQEVKFFTDLGFQRTETLGMSDWMYQKKL